MNFDSDIFFNPHFVVIVFKKESNRIIWFIIIFEYLQTPPIQLTLSSDRGVPFVCNNKLTAILSTVLPPDNVATCQQSGKTLAFYSKVAQFNNWIHEKIGIDQAQPLVNVHPPLYYRNFDLKKKQQTIVVK